MNHSGTSLALAFFLVGLFGANGHAATPGSSRPEVQRNFKQLLETRACPGCDLADADLTRTELKGVNLEGANLSGAKLSLADLSGANLKNANLQDANLGGADLAGANLTGANLTGAVVEGAFLDAIQGKRASTPRPAQMKEPKEKVDEPAEAPAVARPESTPRTPVVTGGKKTAPSEPIAAVPAVLPQEEPQPASSDHAPVPSAILDGQAEPAQPKQLTPMADAVVPTEAIHSSGGAIKDTVRPAETTGTAEAGAVARTVEPVQSEPVAVAAVAPVEAPKPVEPEQGAPPVEERIPPASVEPIKVTRVEEKTVTSSVKAVNRRPEPEPAPIPDVAKEPEKEIETAVAALPEVPPEPPAKTEVKETPSTLVKPESPVAAEPPPPPRIDELTADRQAVLTQLFDKKRCVDCDLSGMDLSGKNLDGFDLERANLKGSNLRGADLEKANLKGAKLDGASLRDADLRKADLYRASFREADLTGAKLEKALVDSTDLTDAVGVNLEGATVVK